MGIVPFAALAIGGPWIFATLFGENWRVAGEYARVLALPQYVGFFIWPMMPTLNILEHQHWQLAWDVGRLVLCIACMAAAQYLGRSPLWVITAYALAMTLGYIAHAVLCFLAIHRCVIRRQAC